MIKSKIESQNLRGLIALLKLSVKQRVLREQLKKHKSELCRPEYKRGTIWINENIIVDYLIHQS